MKNLDLLFFLLLFLSFSCFSQEGLKTSNIIEAPQDWGKESFPLPPSFAPKIKFKGVEEVRFAPGWADKSSPQFWTYTFAWHFHGDPRLTEKIINELVGDYFSGLTASVGKENEVEEEKITKSTASFNEKQNSGSKSYFEGAVEFYDVFFSQKQIKLNVKIKSQYCPEINKSLILFSFSPKTFEHEVWKIFETIRMPKDCRELKQVNETSYKINESKHYELIIPNGTQKGVLILFPGYPENPDIIKAEFKIIEPAIKEGISIALMKFNQRIWLENKEKEGLSNILNKMFEENNLDKKNIHIGGFSSGGNVSLLISNHLIESESVIRPKGVFIIDSPVDLLGLYENAQRNIKRDFSSVSMQESKMIIDQFESNFGKPEKGIKKYQEYSVYTKRTHNLDNLSHLKDVKIRLYTEPDILWWRQNRMNEYEDMNAFFIKSLSDDLIKKFGENVEYIPTVNRGYRSNGNRHPHSWSIVDVNELIKWIKNE